MPPSSPTYKVIFFDAVGTLIHLPRGVGYHYALAGERVGLKLGAAELERAFVTVWKRMPARPRTEAPRAEDDKGWWRELVGEVLQRVSPTLQELDRDAFFEVAYAHFAEAGVWELFPEALDVLEALRPRFFLGVISNFDGRLRMILEQLGISKFFSSVVISSEIGADKPDAFIYQRAAALSGFPTNECLHVGDDPVNDWQGAEAGGMRVFRLQRPKNSLRDLLVVSG